MNIQSPGNGSKLSSNYVPDTKSGTDASSSLVDMELTKLAKSDKQIKTLELQGVHVSLGEGQLVKAIDRAIKALEGPSTMFEMKVHEQTKSIIVKVINKETGETIREIPPEKTLDLVVKMMEFAGILVDEKV